MKEKNCQPCHLVPAKMSIKNGSEIEFLRQTKAEIKQITNENLYSTGNST